MAVAWQFQLLSDVVDSLLDSEWLAGRWHPDVKPTAIPSEPLHQTFHQSPVVNWASQSLIMSSGMPKCLKK